LALIAAEIDGVAAFATCCVDVSLALVGAATCCDVGVALCVALASVACGGDIGIALLLLVLFMLLLLLEAAVVSLYPGGGSFGSLGFKSTLGFAAGGGGGGGGGGAAGLDVCCSNCLFRPLKFILL